MSELTLTVLQLGLLVLLWLFVLGVVGVLRGDLYGTRVAVRPPRPTRPAERPPRPVAPARPASPGARQPPEPRPPAQPRQLVVTEGSLQGTTITLGTSPITVGRAADCTLVVDDEFASGRHARISRVDGQWVLEDLGSTNGTYVRKEQVQGTVPLPVRVPVRIGRTVLELRA